MNVDKNARTRLGSALRLIRVESTTGSWSANGTSQWWDSHTLQGINISHLGKRKIIFKNDFWCDMLVPWRVIPIAQLQKFTPYVVETTMSVLFFWSLKVYKDGKLDNLTYNHPLIWFGCVAIFFTYLNCFFHVFCFTLLSSWKLLAATINNVWLS